MKIWILMRNSVKFSPKGAFERRRLCRVNFMKIRLFSSLYELVSQGEFRKTPNYQSVLGLNLSPPKRTKMAINERHPGKTKDEFGNANFRVSTNQENPKIDRIRNSRSASLLYCCHFSPWNAYSGKTIYSLKIKKKWRYLNRPAYIF